MKRICLARLMDGLYYLKIGQVKLSASIHVVIEDLSRLWHLRLDHQSHDRTQCMNKKYSYIPVFTQVSCDVCHMEKQKKLHFALNNSNSKFVFDLIHVDIFGGPFSTTSIHGFKHYFLYLMIIVGILGDYDQE